MSEVVQRYIGLLVMGYLFAAPMTDRIAIDPRQTDWTSLWTYVWWWLSVPLVFLSLAAAMFVAALVVEATK